MTVADEGHDEPCEDDDQRQSAGAPCGPGMDVDDDVLARTVHSHAPVLTIDVPTKTLSALADVRSCRKSPFRTAHVPTSRLCAPLQGMSFDVRRKDHGLYVRRKESAENPHVTSFDADAFLIDSMMPTYDAVIAEHIVVPADPATTFAAIRALDLLTVHSPLLDLSMWLRGLPARVSGKAEPRLPKLVIDTDMALPGWTFLGQRPDREIAFGAVGRFWQPTIEWRDVAATDFTGFDEPGWGKIAANFSMLPYGASATLLTYECRTVTTDPESRRRFLRYWHLIRPFVGHILRATLRQVRANVVATSMQSTAELREAR